MSQPTATTEAKRSMRTWPVLLLTLPAFTAIWGGWVGLGEKTGFGMINLLPGMVDDGKWSTLNTAITLPIGLETYAAFALHTFMNATKQGTLRKFAGWSALASLLLGGGGQVAYHVMESLGWERAPLWVTAIVGSLPVLVLGLGTVLASLIRREANGQEDTTVKVSLAQRVAGMRSSVQAVTAAARGNVAEVAANVTDPKGIRGVAWDAELEKDLDAHGLRPVVEEDPTPVSPAPTSPAGPRPPRQATTRNGWDVAKAVRLILDTDHSDTEIGDLVGISQKMIQRSRRAVRVLKSDPTATIPEAWKVPATVLDVARREIRAMS